jgi:small subunit ribosomal protein S20
MADHKSAIKAHKQSLKKRERNLGMLGKIRTFTKKVEEFIRSSNAPKAAEAMKDAESVITKSVTKGVLKKNCASRKVSRLVKKVKALEKKA